MEYICKCRVFLFIFARIILVIKTFCHEYKIDINN